MDRGLAATSLSAALTLLLSAAAGAQVPEEARGTWVLGTCDAGQIGLILSTESAFVYDGTRDGGARVTIGEVRWTDAGAVLWKFGLPTILPPIAALVECDALPPAAYAGLAEAIALFQAVDPIRETCLQGSGEECAERIFEFADVSEDDRLSVAEISRIVRAGAAFVSYEAMVSGEAEAVQPDPSARVTQLLGASTFASLVGPVFLGNLIRSYDFDGDNFVTLEEIMQDREPLFERSMVDGAGAVVTTATAQQAIASTLSFVVQQAGQTLGPMMMGVFR